MRSGPNRSKGEAHRSRTSADLMFGYVVGRGSMKKSSGGLVCNYPGLEKRKPPPGKKGCLQDIQENRAGAEHEFTASILRIVLCGREGNFEERVLFRVIHDVSPCFFVAFPVSLG